MHPCFLNNFNNPAVNNFLINLLMLYPLIYTLA
jgi:hypothetical protein